MTSWSVVLIVAAFLGVVWFVTRDDQPKYRLKDIKHFVRPEYTINVRLVSHDKRSLRKDGTEPGITLSLTFGDACHELTHNEERS